MNKIAVAGIVGGGLATAAAIAGGLYGNRVGHGVLKTASDGKSDVSTWQRVSDAHARAESIGYYSIVGTTLLGLAFAGSLSMRSPALAAVTGVAFVGAAGVATGDVMADHVLQQHLGIAHF